MYWESNSTQPRAESAVKEGRSRSSDAVCEKNLHTTLLQQYYRESLKKPTVQDASKRSESSSQQQRTKQNTFRLRQKSEGFFVLDFFDSVDKLQVFLQQQKLISDFELLEIKDVIYSLMSAKPSGEDFGKTAYSYFEILLNSLANLINKFISIERTEIAQSNFELMRNLVGSFENLKISYNKNLASGQYILSPVEKSFLSSFFANIEFLLRRFGKVITMYSVILQKYTVQAYSVKDPRIQGLKEMTRNSPNEIRLERQSSYESNIVSQRNQSSDNRSVASSIHSRLTFLSSDSAQSNDANKVLRSLTKDQKEGIVVQFILKQQTSVWSQQLEKERAQMVPVMLCRICSQRIYADQSKKHSELCQLRLKKISERKDQLKTHNFLDISNKITEAILSLQKPQRDLLSRTISNLQGSLSPNATIQQRAMVPLLDLSKAQEATHAAEKQPEKKNSKTQNAFDLSRFNFKSLQEFDDQIPIMRQKREEGQKGNQDIDFSSDENATKTVKRHSSGVTGPMPTDSSGRSKEMVLNSKAGFFEDQLKQFEEIINKIKAQEQRCEVISEKDEETKEERSSVIEPAFSTLKKVPIENAAPQVVVDRKRSNKLLFSGNIKGVKIKGLVHKITTPPKVAEEIQQKANQPVDQFYESVSSPSSERNIQRGPPQTAKKKVLSQFADVKNDSPQTQLTSSNELKRQTTLVQKEKSFSNVHQIVSEVSADQRLKDKALSNMTMSPLAGQSILKEFQEQQRRHVANQNNKGKTLTQQLTKAAKHEIELLEHWKTMLQNAYYAVTENESLAYNKMAERLLTLQLENIESIVSLPSLSEKTVFVGKEYIERLRAALLQLKEIIDVEKHLQSTQPQTQQIQLEDGILAEKQINKAINHVLTGPNRMTVMSNLNLPNKNLRDMTIKNLKDFLGPGLNLSETKKDNSNISTNFTKPGEKATPETSKSMYHYSQSELGMSKSQSHSTPSDKLNLSKDKNSSSQPISMRSEQPSNSDPAFNTIQTLISDTNQSYDSKQELSQRKDSVQSDSSPIPSHRTVQQFGSQNKSSHESLTGQSESSAGTVHSNDRPIRRVIKYSSEMKVNPAQELRNMQKSSIRKMQNMPKKQSQFKRQEDRFNPILNNLDNSESYQSDATSEEANQAPEQILESVEEQSQKPTPTKQKSSDMMFSQMFKQQLTTDFVIHSDVEPSVRGYACRKAPTLSSESSSFTDEKSLKIMRQNSRINEKRRKGYRSKQDSFASARSLKERSHTGSSFSSSDAKKSRRRVETQSSNPSLTKKSFQEIPFDQRSKRSKTSSKINKSCFAKQSIMDASDSTPVSDYLSMSEESVGEAKTQRVVKTRQSKPIEYLDCKVRSQTKNNFENQTLQTEVCQTQRSCEFLTTNIRNVTQVDEEGNKTRRSRFRIGDDNVSLVGSVNAPKCMADLKYCFKELKDFNKKMVAKSQFAHESRSSRMQSSEYYEDSNRSQSQSQSQSYIQSSLYEAAYSQNVKLTAGTQNEKYIESGLQSCPFTAHSPLFQTQQIQPKSRSDSEVSKGVVETSSDFENMQTNNNFGKFEQTSKFNFDGMSRQQYVESDQMLSHDDSIARIVSEIDRRDQKIPAARKKSSKMAMPQLKMNKMNTNSEVYTQQPLISERKVDLPKIQTPVVRSHPNFQSQVFHKNPSSEQLLESTQFERPEPIQTQLNVKERVGPRELDSALTFKKLGNLQELELIEPSQKFDNNLRMPSPSPLRKTSDLSMRSRRNPLNSKKSSISSMISCQSFKTAFDNSQDMISLPTLTNQRDSPLNKSPQVKNSEPSPLLSVKSFIKMPYIPSEPEETKTESKSPEIVTHLILPTETQLSSESGMDTSHSEEVLTMKTVRFNSCVILPSQKTYCSLDYQSEKQAVPGDKMSIKDFILLKTISSGAYGKVVLARKKATKDLFAIKVLDKGMMVEKNVAEFVMNERNILNQIDNDFIVRGIYTFQSQRYLYMVMEYMKGGDFGTLLENVHALNFETTKFYLAHIVQALEHLHSMGIAHRDLKPENILIAADGHVKLTDFGLSEAGLRKKVEKTIVAKKVQFKSKSQAVFKNQIQNVEKLEVRASQFKPKIEIGFDKPTESKKAADGLLLPGNDERDAKRTVDMDIADEIGGNQDFLPQQDQELIDRAKPNYTSMLKKPRPRFNVPKKIKFQSCVYDGPEYLKQKPNLKQENAQKQAEAPQPEIVKVKKPRILGTADYMAPEVIKGESANQLLDFWALGVIGFEFLTGYLPFNDETPDKIFTNILEKEIEWPDVGYGDGQIHPIAKDFLQKLLQRDPIQRLGAKEGTKELKRHAFFAGINWKNLINEPVPWLPQGKDDAATNFPKANDDMIQEIINEEEEQIQVPSNKTQSNATNNAFEHFEGVSYASLTQINEREANKAMTWAKKQLRKQNTKQHQNVPNRFAESESIVQSPNLTIKDLSAFIKKEI